MCSLEKQKCLLIDKSRKGSIDSNIVDLINYLNEQPEYCTTSSCAGRIIVYQQAENCNGPVKKGCQWLFVSHNEVQLNDILASLKDHKDSAVFKFEPFIMHVKCDSLNSAKHLLAISISSGFRNSGITVGNSGKIMMAVRSTHGLEVPISCNGDLLVSDQYLSYIVKKGNDKLMENQKRIDKFFFNLRNKINNLKVEIEMENKTKHQKINFHRSEKRLSKETSTEYDLDGLSELLRIV